MKKIILLSLIMLPILIQSCYVESQGPPGPRGFNGADGLDGRDGEESYVFDYEFTFNRDTYSQLLVLPDNFQATSTDAMLVYLLWEVDEDNREIWRLLPQGVFTPDGLLQYNFDHTQYDASVFLEAEFNLDLLGPSYLEDWVARVVVIPANYTGRLDYTDYEAVKKTFKLKDTELDLSNYAKKPLE